MSTKIEGEYLLTKSNLHKSDVELVIGTRKKPEISKPKYYLLHKVSPKQFVYVSSLYPLDNSLNAFSLDFKGQKLTLKIDKENSKAEIQMLHNSITVTLTDKL
jgi:hypothetical protein